MRIPGFPDELRVGDARVAQTEGPLWTQVTSIRQQPGWRPTYLKSMSQVSVGLGQVLTVCQLDVRVPEDLLSAMEVWRDRALAVIASVAALLDERVAQELVLEDLLVFNTSGSEIVGVVDHVTKVRKFHAANRMLKEHRAGLEALGSSIDFEANSPFVSSSRWYLRGAQLGPVADSIVFFWIALEALSKPPHGTKLTSSERRLSDVEWVERAVAEAGVTPTDVSPTIGRLAGLRAEVVHGGVEQPALLDEGFYALEQLVRLLVRHRFGLNPFSWPLAPDNSNLRPPLRYLAEQLHNRPETRWE